MWIFHRFQVHTKFKTYKLFMNFSRTEVARSIAMFHQMFATRKWKRMQLYNIRAIAGASPLAFSPLSWSPIKDTCAVSSEPSLPLEVNSLLNVVLLEDSHFFPMGFWVCFLFLHWSWVAGTLLMNCFCLLNQQQMRNLSVVSVSVIEMAKA